MVMKPLVLLVLILPASSPPAAAKLRDTTVEIYGYTGSYCFGNASNLLKGREWNRPVGADGLLRLPKRWGLLIDVVTSRLGVNEGAHGGIDHHPKRTSTGKTLTFSTR